MSKKRYTFYLEASLMDEFRRVTNANGIPMSEILNRLVRAYNKHEATKTPAPVVPEELAHDV